MRTLEYLLHFKCDYCGWWWSIGDADPNRLYTCPWCEMQEPQELSEDPQ